MARDDSRDVREEAHFTDRTTSADNRREHPRFAVTVDVTLISEHNFYSGLAENLSCGGIFIATHALKSIGERIAFSINLPGVGREVHGVGEVRWVRQYSEASDTPPGIGLRFVELSPEASDTIAKFLEGREPLFYDE